MLGDQKPVHAVSLHGPFAMVDDPMLELTSRLSPLTPCVHHYGLCVTRPTNRFVPASVPPIRASQGKQVIDGTRAVPGDLGPSRVGSIAVRPSAREEPGFLRCVAWARTGSAIR